MGKEEIARNEQFLLFPQCFLLNQIIVSPFIHVYDIVSLFAAKFEEPKIGISGKGLRLVQIQGSCRQQIIFVSVKVENNVGKGENASNQHFLF